VTGPIIILTLSAVQTLVGKYRREAQDQIEGELCRSFVGIRQALLSLPLLHRTAFPACALYLQHSSVSVAFKAAAASALRPSPVQYLPKPQVHTYNPLHIPPHPHTLSLEEGRSADADLRTLCAPSA
jgi:hypothetical protein